jgi:hypothetical protein
VEEERTKDSSKLPCGANEEGKDKSKAEKSETKRTETKAGLQLLLQLLLLHRRLTIFSLSSCVGNGVSRETTPLPSAGGKTTLWIFILFFFPPDCLSRLCVYSRT